MKSLGHFAGTLHAFEMQGCRVEEAILRKTEAREVSIEVRGPCAALGLAPRDVVQMNLAETDGRYAGELSGRSGGFAGRAWVEGRIFQQADQLVFLGTVVIGKASFGLLLDLKRRSGAA